MRAGSAEPAAGRALWQHHGQSSDIRPGRMSQLFKTRYPEPLKRAGLGQCSGCGV